MKKKLFALITIIIVMAMSLCAIGCSTEKHTELYKVTLDYDADRGQVTVSDKDGNAATEFAAGTTVVIAVTPAEGYEVEAFKVNDAAAELDSGVYSQNISSDLVVSVTFKQTDPNGPADPETYNVTLDYDAQYGQVTVHDRFGEPAEEFVSGAAVVIAVTPVDGYEVKSFKVNGVDAELNHGVYSQNISSDLAVSVTFRQAEPDPDANKTPEELFAAAFEGVSERFQAAGTYTYRIEGEPDVINVITTVFGDGALSICETDITGEEDYYNEVYIDDEGVIAVPLRDINNEVTYIRSDPAEPYADYDNPFKRLTVSDFEVTDNKSVFALTDLDKARSAATAITGYNESIASFNVTVFRGRIFRINIVTQRILAPGTEDTYYTSTYEFSLSKWGTADVDPDRVGPYQKTADHEKLEQALAAASRASNYTVHVHEHEEGYDDLEYDVYVTETAIYDSCEGWESGYVEMSLDPEDEDAKLVYPFRIGDEDDGPEKKDKIILDDAVGYPTVRAMRADFGGFAPELFQCNNNVYTLHSDSIKFTSDILMHFADGADNIILYRDYTLSVQITLRDGALYQVEMYYYVYGALVRRTLTYSAFDETVMPITFDDYVKESVLDDYIGTYTDGNIVVKVTEDGMSINNYPIEITAYSAMDQTFTGVFNGRTCYIMYMSAKQLAVIIDADTYIVTNIEIEAVEIPAAYNGVWTQDANSITIAYNKVMFGGNMLKVLSYSEDEGLVALRGKVTYRMILSADGDETKLIVRTLSENITSVSYTMTKSENAFILPEDFVGTYADFRDMVDYKVVVTLNGITVSKNGIQTIATEVAVGTDSVKGTVLNFKLGDVDYVIARQAYGDGINLSGGSVDVNLSRIEDDDPADPPALDVEIPEAFYGDYMYLDIANRVYYYLSIDESGIAAVIDNSSAEYTAEILEFDPEYDFMITVSINGNTYYLFGENEENGVYNTIRLMNGVEGEGSIEVALNREGYEAPDDPDAPTFTVPANFIGTYEGTRDEVTYVLTITAEGMTVTAEGGEPVSITIRDYQTNASRTKFTVIMSLGYTSIQYNGNLEEMGDEPIQKLYFMDNEEIGGFITFNRVSE